jgi:hypothetical protein
MVSHDAEGISAIQRAKKPEWGRGRERNANPTACACVQYDHETPTSWGVAEQVGDSSKWVEHELIGVSHGDEQRCAGRDGRVVHACRAVPPSSAPRERRAHQDAER